MSKSLVSLILDFNSSIGCDGFAALCNGLRLNSSLKRLSVRHCGIGCSGVSDLCKILSYPQTAIRILDLEGNNLGGLGLSTISECLSKNDTLLELGVADNNIGSTEADVNALYHFGVVLSNHKSLTSLNLIWNSIGPDGAMSLMNGIGKSKNIISLRIDTNLNSKLYDSIYRCSKGMMVKKKKSIRKKKKKV